MKTKQCINCHKTFTIYPEDSEFYKLIDVSEPTHCPTCRQQRRCTWRNEHNLYKRKCSFSGKEIISMYHPSSPFPVYDQDIWWSDKWDELKYGREFDFSKHFFTQLKELQNIVPRLSLFVTESENCYYNNHTLKSKNCYLNCDLDSCEEIMYSNWMIKCKSCCDCSYCFDSELLYDCLDIKQSYNCVSCQQGENLNYCYFSFDCKNCANCLYCTNLRNKEFQINNQQVTKEEFDIEINKILTSNYTFNTANTKFANLKKKAIYQFSNIKHSENCSGNNLVNNKNVHWAFDVYDSENSKYLFDTMYQKECCDIYQAGFVAANNDYEIHAGGGLNFSMFCSLCLRGNNVLYSDNCFDCSDIFGCISLKKKQYCIFNKQYSSVDYKILKDKIISHMKKTGEWGEYMPIQNSPFAYNESIAQFHYPIKKEEVLAKKWQWRDEEKSILNRYRTQGVYVCKKCNKEYLLTEAEKNFYKSLNLSRPIYCNRCRLQDRIIRRNPRALWQGRCMCTKPHHNHSGQCEHEFQTTYSPEREEIIYCEDCYQREIY